MNQEEIEIQDSEDMDAKQIIAARGYTLQKVNFKSSEGADCYACILMRKADEEKFKSAYAAGKIDLEDFGEVLVSGLGKEIPEFQKLFLDEMFGNVEEQA